MSVRPAARGRSLLAGCLVAMLCAGCAADAEQQPAVAPSSGSTTGATTASGDSDGVTTASDRYPEWKSIEGLHMPRDDFGTAVVGSEVWVMGGMSGDRGNRLTSVEVLDTRTERWRTTGIEMPVGLASFETTAVGPRIYAFGGFDAESRATASSLVLDTRTGKWRELPPLPHPRYAHTVTLHDGLIYVIGGWNGERQVWEVDVFDPRSEEWQTLARPMAHPRDSLKAASTPKGIVVAGGHHAYEDSAVVDLFDPRTGKWRSLPDLPVPMSRGGLAYARGKVWASLHEASYVLDLDHPRRWVEANPLTLSRHGMGYAVVRGSIYSIAGCALDPLRDVRTVDRLTLG